MVTGKRPLPMLPGSPLLPEAEYSVGYVVAMHCMIHHFHGGHGPTAEQPGPLPADQLTKYKHMAL